MPRALDRTAAENEASARSDDAFVGHCEQIISVLNDTWMVKWTME
ncbi:hypothetical protein ACFWY6_03805 [Streptomyces sp. NPDC059037]